MNDLIFPPKGSEDAYDLDSTWYFTVETPRGPRPNLLSVRQLVDMAVHDAFIAGAESAKGIGLNLSKEERADQYCKDKGLRP